MPCSSRRSVSRRQPEWLRLQARTDDSRESTPNTWAASSTSKTRRAALVSKVAVLGLHVNSTLTSSDASGGSGDQVPCTGSSGRRESAYWREPSATDGRQSVTRTGRVALLDPAARSKVSHSPTTPGASLTTVRAPGRADDWTLTSRRTRMAPSQAWPTSKRVCRRRAGLRSSLTASRKATGVPPGTRAPPIDRPCDLVGKFAGCGH